MKYVLVSFLVVVAALGFSMSRVSAFDPNAQICSTGSSGASSTDLCKSESSTPSDPVFGPNGLASVVVEIFSIVIGIAAVLMIVFAGFEYTTSGGDSQKLNTAKNTIIFAVVGLAIAALAQIIVFFVFNHL